MLKYFILIIGCVSSLFCYADDIVYPQCNEKEESPDLTRKFIANVRDNYCLPLSKEWPQCLNAYNNSHSCPLPITVYDHMNDLYKDLLEANQIQNLKGISNIPPICFATSTALRTSFSQPSTFYQCHNDKASISEPGPCVNKEYIELITRAFNRVANCFGFVTKEEKSIIFALLHHESRFLLNKVEESGEKEDVNRCFGQLDNGFVSDLNKYIQFGIGRTDKNGKPIKGFMSQPDPAFEEYGNMYKEAHKKCPFLDKTLVPHTSKLKDTDLIKDKLGNTSFGEEHDKRKDEIICKTSHDPYPCLFYTMYGLKVSLHKIDNLLSDSSLTSLTLDGTSYRIFDKTDTKLRWVIAIWAHNAGKDGIINKAFPSFIQYLKKSLKKKIAKPYKSCKVPSCRDFIVDGIFLSTKTLINKFKDYVLKGEDRDGDGKIDYRVSNSDEVSEIVDKIQNDLKSFNDVKGLCPFKFLD